MDDNRYSKMQYRRTGRSGPSCRRSRLASGRTSAAMRHSSASAPPSAEPSTSESTHFDLANNYGPPYGSAEKLRPHPGQKDLASHRDEQVISTKAG